MKEIEFNLLDEKWIRVRLPDNAVREVSLTEALIHSHEYADLAGETATQDAATLRLLLSIPLTVFYRVNTQGKKKPLMESKDALVRWKEIWDLGQLPEAPIMEYLQKWHERFWLFHPKRPFWQIPEAKSGTHYDAAKLIGELSESRNKTRFFSSYSGREKSTISYPQAARWLLNVNAYDDTSAKPKEKGLPSPGVGWLGKIGFIQARGNDLFETIMLNLTLLQDGNALWDENVPCWELDEARSDERVEIPLPTGLAQLYTLQSRRILLHKEDDRVTGFSLLGGDFFKRENAFTEQMTLWRGVKGEKDQPAVFVPARHDPSKQFWREFSTVFCHASDEVHKPGVVQWISLLQSSGLLDPERYICFKVSGIQYGDKDFFVNDSFSDALLLHAALIGDMETEWQARIALEVERCDNVARQIAYFAQELKLAAGSKDSNSDSAKVRFYFSVDKPFREWLRSIDTQRDDPDEKVLEWQRKSKGIAMEMAKDMVRKAGTAALVGRSVKTEDKNGSERIELYAAPKSFNKLRNVLRKIYPENQKEGGQNE